MSEKVETNTSPAKTKNVTLRAFEINNPNLSKASSNARSELVSKLAELKVAKDRCMLLNMEDPNLERDLISYFKDSPVSITG